MNISELWKKSIDFALMLDKVKQQASTTISWYPYNTLGTFAHLNKLLTGENRDLSPLLGNKAVLDIGAADGDIAFFLESLGYEVDILDYGPTNYNLMRGARWLKAALNSKVGIYEVDLDTQFAVPQKNYQIIFFLGILYHLKNPFYAMETLSKVGKYCLVSTRIAQVSPDHRTRFSHLAVAYLLHPNELNNDSTNYWIFSETGLLTLFERTGWRVLDFTKMGATVDSDPNTLERDERAFLLLESCKYTG